jgi:hypothetical protein
VTELVTGNPARAPCVKSIIDAIKKKAGVKGAAATRHHAEAMTIEELGKMMRWSEKECPNEMLDPTWVPKDQNELRKILIHAMMRAFSASGFTLWTR